MKPAGNDVAQKLLALKILIVDDEAAMRKITRSLLQAIGIRTIYEAHGGRSELEAVRTLLPDAVIVDWEMPQPNGPEFVRAVRSPDTFPVPHVPIIMLTGHGERSRVIAAVNLGVNDFLVKPVSAKALFGRLVSLITEPRRMVRIGDYYGPEPRRRAGLKPAADAARAGRA